MFNISFSYHRTEDAVFDLEYFVHDHMPMVLSLLTGKRGFKGVSVEVGLDIELYIDNHQVQPSTIVITQFYFDTIENFMLEYSFHEKKIIDDLGNCSNIKPIIQIQKVEMLRT